MTWLGPVLAITLGTLGYGLWRAYYGYTKFGSVAASAWSQPWLIAAGALALTTLTLLALRIRRRSLLVGLYPDGLLLRRHGKNRFLRWDQIAGLKYGILRRHLFGVTIANQQWLEVLLKPGPPIILDSRVHDLPTLFEQIKDAYHPHIYPDLERKLHAHKWLPFGPLTLHRQAIKLKGRQIPWKDVERLSVKSGELWIALKSGRSVHLPTAQIPNLDLLLKLINSGVTA
jgi:hypothetical protein